MSDRMNYEYAPANGGEQEEESRIDARSIVIDVIHNWWVVLLVCMTVALMMYIFLSEKYKPTYYAEVTFVVSSKDGGSDQVYSNLVVASKLAESFSYVFESPALKQKIAESLNMKSFSGSIVANSVENTNLINIGVIASSPQLAFDEINGIIRYHSIFSDNLLGNAVLDVLKAPTIPSKPSNSFNKTYGVLLYTLIAGVATILVIAVVSILGDEVKTEKELYERVNCQPLATVFHEKKNLSIKARLKGEKTSMLISNPTTSFRFAETYRLFRTRIEYLMKQKKYKVLMVTSVHENEGKTTAAANVAITLALNNKKTLLVDGDMLKPALYKVLDTKITRGMAVNEVIKSDIDFATLPRYAGLPSLHLLLGKTGLRNSTEIISSNDMKSFIEKAKNYFDYIVIDTPPVSVAGDAECFAEISDCALLVIKQGGTRASGINDALESINISGADVLGCIFNNVRSWGFFGMSLAETGYEGGYKGYNSDYGDSRRGGYGGYGRQSGERVTRSSEGGSAGRTAAARERTE